jgi:hypothetical protein
MTKTITKFAHFAESQLGIQNFEKAFSDFRHPSSALGIFEGIAQLAMGISNVSMTLIPGGSEAHASFKGVESVADRMAVSAREGIVSRYLKEDSGIVHTVMRDRERSADLYQHFMIEKISNKSAAGTIIDSEGYKGAVEVTPTKFKGKTEDDILGVYGSRQMERMFAVRKNTTDIETLLNLDTMSAFHRTDDMSPLYRDVVKTLEGEEFVHGERANTLLYTGLKSNMRNIAKKEFREKEERRLVEEGTRTKTRLLDDASTKFVESNESTIRRDAFQKIVAHVEENEPESEYKTLFLARAKKLQFLQEVMTVRTIKLGAFAFYYGISMAKSSLSTR